MNTISASVGRGGSNRPNDVRLIQHLLNRQFPASSRSLSEDGICGLLTMTRIEEYQRKFLHLASPDGRVDPNGATIKKLLADTPSKPGASKRPANVEAFVQKTVAVARRVRNKWNVPVSICIAQAALESGWGSHVKGNAYFGIKGKSPAGGTTTFATTEFINGKKVSLQDSFRAYKDFEESAEEPV